MSIKAIFSDIDGTLLNKDRELSTNTIKSFKSLPDDISIILASSRMPRAMRHLQEDLDVVDHPLVSYNGAYILSNGTTEAETLYSTGIDPLACKSIADMAEVGDVHVSIYSEDEWYVPENDQWAKREEKNTKVSPKIGNILEILEQWAASGRVVHKLMCMGGANEIDKLHKFLESDFSNSVHAYRSKDTYIEIAPVQTSKAHALQVIEDKLGLFKETVLAFGDNYNDIEMLKAAGIGVAVENAKPEVKTVADSITSSNIDDGVAESIKKHFFG